MNLIQMIFISYKDSLFIYLWLCWVFVAAQAFLWLWGLETTFSLWCAVSYCLGFSWCGAWILGFTGFSSCGKLAQEVQLLGSRAQAQIVVVQGLSCSMACGIFLDQELNTHLLHWQANSVPLRHQGLLKVRLCIFLQKEVMRKPKLVKMVVCKK